MRHALAMQPARQQAMGSLFPSLMRHGLECRLRQRPLGFCLSMGCVVVMRFALPVLLALCWAHRPY